jgi:hypothetical protein
MHSKAWVVGLLAAAALRHGGRAGPPGPPGPPPGNGADLPAPPGTMPPAVPPGTPATIPASATGPALLSASPVRLDRGRRRFALRLACAGSGKLSVRARGVRGGTFARAGYRCSTNRATATLRVTRRSPSGSCAARRSPRSPASRSAAGPRAWTSSCARGAARRPPRCSGPGRPPAVLARRVRRAARLPRRVGLHDDRHDANLHPAAGGPGTRRPRAHSPREAARTTVSTRSSRAPGPTRRAYPIVRCKVSMLTSGLTTTSHGRRLLRMIGIDLTRRRGTVAVRPRMQLRGTRCHTPGTRARRSTERVA